MKILVVGMEQVKDRAAAEAFYKMLEEKTQEVMMWKAKRKITNEDIEEWGTQLLITFELSGFDNLTLTDGIAYNLLSCKQLHFLLDENLPNEAYLERQLSIAMFFFCVGEAYRDALLQKYPDLPYLDTVEAYEGDENQKAAALMAALDKMVRENLKGTTPF